MGAIAPNFDTVFLTGQGFNYQRGRFLRPEIEAGAQAWEIGVRASWVDFNDRDVQAGEQLNLGLAVNWYLSNTAISVLICLKKNNLFSFLSIRKNTLSSLMHEPRCQMLGAAIS